MTVQSIVFAFADSAEEWNTSEWRSRTPSDALNGSGRYTARCIPISDFTQYGQPGVQEVMGPAEAVVVQRNLLTPDVWEACDYWRGVGKLVLADLDDDYPHLLPQNPAYRFWILDRAELKKKTGYAPIEALTEGFKHCDGLLSPNELILKDWAHILRGYWLPNYARWKWYKGIKQKPLEDGKIVIGWGGSVSHFDGWWFSGLSDAVPAINEMCPQVVWKICGGDKRVKRLFDDIAPGRWVDQDGVPPDKWPRQVATFDIGIAPLCGPGSPQGERYDLRRSWLKAIEYLLTGVPWVASEGIVYEKLDGKGGFLVENNVLGWVDGLVEIINNIETYKATSKKLMRWARENLTMEFQIDQYVDVFNRALADKNTKYGLRLPNVVYSEDQFKEMDEIKDLEIALPDEDITPLLLEYQSATYKAARDWMQRVDLHHDGVDVGRCLEYPVLHELNNQVYAEVTG